MKRSLLLAAFVMLRSLAPAADSSAPYFQILENRNEQPTEQLPLKSSFARVAIDGTIARVRLTQCYGNTGTVPIEALYVFPASTRAAVHGMTLTTGGRVIAARIRESVKARAEYETAKSQRKTAALLEEHRPNVFQMSVANLLPGDDVTVEVEWTETIPAVDATYEYVLPTVVGPRYTGGGSHSAGETWTANPHLTEGVPNPATLGIEVVLNTALPLAEVICPSHPGLVDFKARDRAEIKLALNPGEDAANRDFILRWKLGGDGVDAGLLLHRGENGGHFLLQVEPPQQVKPGQVPPRDYVMVVDVSGSMNGFPLDTAKALLRDLVLGLKPTDTFNVMYFASGSGLFAERPQTATKEHLAEAVRFLEKQPAGGGTELKAALRRALALPGGDDRSRSIILVTDGYVSADHEVREMVRKNIGRANLFAFGIGSSVNRELIESVARAGGGEPAVVTCPSEAAAAARRFLTSISSPVLAKVRIEAEGFQLSQTAPSPCPDVFASRALIINGTWQGEPKGEVIVRGIGGNGEAFEKRIDVAQAAAKGGLEHPALPVLWARERVRLLAGQGPPDSDTIREITDLGLTHSLLTAYTSFVAVDETPRNLAHQAVPVKQPLPLPQGVTAAAVGGSQSSPLVHNGSVPEPGALGLISLLALLFAVQRRR
ncbi:MAG: VIT and VWA domain-containing protein [Akkermansiaceae bacterium]|nr:VIT and VWA domain-containing protein [Akkermansiaceae bacterium]MCF7733144.1 VIT and VWA domain-containing protein [Akkermansiaceae bacterium]